MSTTDPRQFLELCQRYMSAANVRLEVGLRPPNGTQLVCAELGDGWRVVAEFHAPIDDHAQTQERLEAFVQSFETLATDTSAGAPRLQEARAHSLDWALSALAASAGAVRAVVVDRNSPVLWGASGAERLGDDAAYADELARIDEQLTACGLDFLALAQDTTVARREALEAISDNEAAAGALDRAVESVLVHRDDWDEESWKLVLLSARATSRLRRSAGRGLQAEQEDSFGYVARAVGGVYWLVLVYDSRFSELHTLSAVIRAAPAIESLVAALPPDDPGGGGNVIRLSLRQ